VTLRIHQPVLLGRVAIAAALLAALVAPATVTAQDGSDEQPAAKVATGGCLAGGADCLETANLIVPDLTVTDPQPHNWESVAVASDGTSLSVYFWMGVPPCHGLHSVEVTPTESGIDLELFTGVPEGAEDALCIAIAQLFRTDVQLEEALISGAFPGAE
jgi:uncharacterized membrane protein